MKIIAHRGLSSQYPENTLLAFTKAIEQGADGIELDVHWSADHKLIVHHDYDLARPCKGKGFIHQTDAAYIRTLDAGAWLDKQFAGERIPFLEEVFATFGNRIWYEIELKGFTPEFCAAVVALAEDFDVLDRIEFTSPHTYILTHLRAILPDAKTGWIADLPPSWMARELWQAITAGNAKLGSISVIHAPLNVLTKAYVKQLHEHGFAVHAANCDTPAAIQKARTLGVDQITTALITERAVKS